MIAFVPPRRSIEFPAGKEFAFTILDDTDDATVENVRPLYDLLHELGIHTTKTVWPLDCPEGSANYFAADTLDSAECLAFAHELAARGFELTWHNATMESSERGRTVEGLERFKACFGRYPSLHCNHGQNRENIYWGHKRYSNPVLQLLAGRARRHREVAFEGEVASSPFYWGDLCREHFRFVRNFSFYELNCLKVDPLMPYRERQTPAVNYWFSTSDAPDATAFKRLVTRRRIERLRRERGVCIVSTHLGKGFVRDGRVDPGVEDILRFLAEQPGWFVPVSEILEELLKTAPRTARSRASLWRLELRHAIDRVRGLS